MTSGTSDDSGGPLPTPRAGSSQTWWQCVCVHVSIPPSRPPSINASFLPPSLAPSSPSSSSLPHTLPLSSSPHLESLPLSLPSPLPLPLSRKAGVSAQRPARAHRARPRHRTATAGPRTRNPAKSRHTHTHTHTHDRATARPGPGHEIRPSRVGRGFPSLLPSRRPRIPSRNSRPPQPNTPGLLRRGEGGSRASGDRRRTDRKRRPQATSPTLRSRQLPHSVAQGAKRDAHPQAEGAKDRVVGHQGHVERRHNLPQQARRAAYLTQSPRFPHMAIPPPPVLFSLPPPFLQVPVLCPAERRTAGRASRATAAAPR